MGTRLPIARTAMGRAVLCAASDAERERLSGLLRAEDPDSWPEVRAGLARSGARYRERGVVGSISHGVTARAALGVTRSDEFGRVHVTPSSLNDQRTAAAVRRSASTTGRRRFGEGTGFIGNFGILSRPRTGTRTVPGSV